MNPDPTAGPSAPAPYRDSEGVGLREEQVASFEVIIEVEESTGKLTRKEVVRPHPAPGLRLSPCTSLRETAHPPVVSIGVGWGLPPALPGVRVQDTVVCMHRVTQVHTLLLLT